jgi:hypothetical protein
MLCTNCGNQTDTQSGRCAWCASPLPATQIMQPPSAPPPPDPGAWWSTSGTQSTYPPQAPGTNTPTSYVNAPYVQQVPQQVPAPVPAKPSRLGRKLLIGLPVLLGIGAAAAIAFVLIKGTRHHTGGAANPKAAVQALADSISAGDFAAAADVLAPDELRDISGLVTATQDAGVRVGLTTATAKNGFDLKIDISSLDVETLSKSAAKVTIAGSATVHSATQLSPLMTGLIGNGSHSGRIASQQATFRTRSGKTIRPFVVVIKEGDGWFASPLLTAAEYVRLAANLPEGDYTLVNAPKGASSPAATPKAALQKATQAISDLEPSQLAKVLTPGEARVLRIYDAMIIRAIENSRKSSSTFNQFKMEFDGIEFQDGSSADLPLLKAFQATFSSSDGDGGTQVQSYSVDSDCLSQSRGAGGNSSCGISRDALASHLGLKNLPVSFVKSGNGYLFSPFGTLTNNAMTILQHVDKTTMFAVQGLDVLDDATPAGPGQQLDLDLGTKGYAVVELPAGSDVTITTSEYSGGEYTSYKSDNGSWSLPNGYKTASNVGRYADLRARRIVFQRCYGRSIVNDCEADAPTTVHVSLSSIYRQTMPDPGGIIHAGLEAGGLAVYTLPAPPNGQPYVVTSGQDSDVRLDGNVLQIINRSQQHKDYAVSVEQRALFGFDGGRTTTEVTTDSGSTFVSLHVTQGQRVVVRFTCQDGQSFSANGNLTQPYSDVSTGNYFVQFTYNSINQTGAMQFSVTENNGSAPARVSITATQG